MNNRKGNGVLLGRTQTHTIDRRLGIEGGETYGRFDVIGRVFLVDAGPGRDSVDGRGFLVQRTKELVQLLVENAALLGNGLVSARQRRIVIRRVKAGHFANKFFDCLAKDSFEMK